MNNQISPDTIVIIDSFPLSLCQPVRNYRTRIFNGLADIGCNASKNLWFYGFKVHMLVTLSGYILNYIVTPASVHDIRAVDDLLENCHHSYITLTFWPIWAILVVSSENIWSKKVITFGLPCVKTW